MTEKNQNELERIVNDEVGDLNKYKVPFNIEYLYRKVCPDHEYVPGDYKVTLADRLLRDEYKNTDWIRKHPDFYPRRFKVAYDLLDDGSDTFVDFGFGLSLKLLFKNKGDNVEVSVEKSDPLPNEEYESDRENYPVVNLKRDYVVNVLKRVYEDTVRLTGLE